MTKMPRSEAAIMPPNTGVPTSRRASFEAPVAITSGTRPRMKANDVIITGRKRSRAPSVGRLVQRDALLALLLGELDDQDAVLGREADQHDHADLRIEIERQAGQDDRHEGARARRPPPTAAPAPGWSSSRRARPGTDRRTAPRSEDDRGLALRRAFPGRRCRSTRPR